MGWQKVVEDQVDTLKRSCLNGAIQSILVGVVSNEDKPQEELCDAALKVVAEPRAQCMHGTGTKSGQQSMFEWQTLSMLPALISETRISADARVLYMHSKGTSPWANKDGKQDSFQNIWLWRRAMEHNLIVRAKDCMSLMEKFYAWHYSGNFWWASANHLTKLSGMPSNAISAW